MGNIKFESVKEVVKAYQENFPINKFEAIKQVVKIFEEKYLKRILERKKRQFETAKGLLEQFKNTEIYRRAISYDLFRVLRPKISENNIRDVIASVIDPARSPFGKEILTEILGTLSSKKYKDINIISKIVKDTPENRFICRPECCGDSSRIDLRIFTGNIDKENTVFDFEMKVEGGSETYRNGEYQTEREYEDLKRFCSEENIPVRNALPFFVTPHGTHPVSKDFIPLSMSRLREIILKVLKKEDRPDLMNFDECGIGAVCHFFRSGYVF